MHPHQKGLRRMPGGGEGAGPVQEDGGLDERENDRVAATVDEDELGMKSQELMEI